MKKKRIQLIVMILLLALFAGAFFGIRHYNAMQEKKAGEESSSEVIDIVTEDMDEILSLSYDLGGTTYRFVKEEDTWKYEEDPEIRLVQSDVKLMLYYLAPLQASAKLDSPMSLEEYGLAEPKQTIRLTSAQGEYVLKLGDQNMLTGDCYLMKDGDDAVYSVPATTLTACTKTLEALTEAEETEAGTDAEISQ